MKRLPTKAPSRGIDWSVAAESGVVAGADDEGAGVAVSVSALSVPAAILDGSIDIVEEASIGASPDGADGPAAGLLAHAL